MNAVTSPTPATESTAAKYRAHEARGIQFW